MYIEILCFSPVKKFVILRDNNDYRTSVSFLIKANKKEYTLDLKLSYNSIDNSLKKELLGTFSKKEIPLLVEELKMNVDELIDILYDYFLDDYSIVDISGFFKMFIFEEELEKNEHIIAKNFNKYSSKIFMDLKHSDHLFTYLTVFIKNEEFETIEYHTVYECGSVDFIMSKIINESSIDSFVSGIKKTMFFNKNKVKFCLNDSFRKLFKL